MRNEGMRFSLALTLAASLGLFACGGSHEDAKTAADVSADWSTFSGKYSETASPREAKHAAKGDSGDVAKKESGSKAKEAPVEKTEEAPIAAAPAAPTPKTSKGTVKGESLSSIGVDVLTEAATSTTKSKLVSSGIVTGAKYETVTVETKKATIKVTRPASSPNATGPEVASPKTKAADAGKTTASWYDADADVLITVTAPKKAAAQKTLSTLVSH